MLVSSWDVSPHHKCSMRWEKLLSSWSFKLDIFHSFIHSLNFEQVCIFFFNVTDIQANRSPRSATLSWIASCLYLRTSCADISDITFVLPLERNQISWVNEEYAAKLPVTPEYLVWKEWAFCLFCFWKSWRKTCCCEIFRLCSGWVWTLHFLILLC